MRCEWSLLKRNDVVVRKNLQLLLVGNNNDVLTIYDKDSTLQPRLSDEFIDSLVGGSNDQKWRWAYDYYLVILRKNGVFKCMKCRVGIDSNLFKNRRPDDPWIKFHKPHTTGKDGRNPLAFYCSRYYVRK